jgi:hypothetical protein
MEKKFIAFLKQHRAYSKFKTNLLWSTYKNKYLVRDLINTTFLPETYILFSFDWRSSPQGYTYWLKLSQKWEKECSN